MQRLYKFCVFRILCLTIFFPFCAHVLNLFNCICQEKSFLENLLCPPQLLWIPDRNHDDIPDGEPVVVLDGLNPTLGNRHTFARSQHVALWKPSEKNRERRGPRYRKDSPQLGAAV